MPIASSDILFKYSIKTGSAGNSLAQTDVNASLGKYISTTLWTGGNLHDLFSPITGTENMSGQVDYRCIFIHNNHGSLTFQGVVVWISTQGASATASIGVDPTAASGISSSSAQAVQVANTTTAPAGVTFSTPLTEGTGISLGDIEAGQCIAIWIRRTAHNTLAYNFDTITLGISGDTEA